MHGPGALHRRWLGAALIAGVVIAFATGPASQALHPRERRGALAATGYSRTHVGVGSRWTLPPQTHTHRRAILT